MHNTENYIAYAFFPAPLNETFAIDFYRSRIVPLTSGSWLFISDCTVHADRLYVQDYPFHLKLKRNLCTVLSKPTWKKAYNTNVWNQWYLLLSI